MNNWYIYIYQIDSHNKESRVQSFLVLQEQILLKFWAFFKKSMGHTHRFVPGEFLHFIISEKTWTWKCIPAKLDNKKIFFILFAKDRDLLFQIVLNIVYRKILGLSDFAALGGGVSAGGHVWGGKLSRILGYFVFQN